jgi:N-acetylneuraminic acid mutarotase
MSLTRDFSAAVIYNGKLFVVGGRGPANTALSSVEVYDFKTKQWSLLPADMPTARSFHGAVVCGAKLYVVGGNTNGGTFFDSAEVYDFAAETWSTLAATMPQGVGFIVRCSVFDRYLLDDAIGSHVCSLEALASVWPMAFLLDVHFSYRLTL